MLNRSHISGRRIAAPADQRGVVLMIALIMLVAMTLAGIALVRSTDTTNIIAGNLAFKQGATSSGDQGTEAAIQWLTSTTQDLAQTPLTANGYYPFRSQVGSQSWDAFFNSFPAKFSITTASGNGVDSAGNTVQYVIERLCNGTGASGNFGADCSQPQTLSASSASSKGANSINLLVNTQIYYRVTTQIKGPRNTVSYIQTIVAI